MPRRGKHAMDLGDLLHVWHDFYLLIGTASATLIGLMFVAASIASSTMTEQSKAGLQAFFSPTVVHFAAVLIICVVLSAPLRTWAVLGGLVLTIGAVGVGYSSTVWVRMGRRGRHHGAAAPGAQPRAPGDRDRAAAACRAAQRLGHHGLGGDPHGTDLAAGCKLRCLDLACFA